MASGVIEVAALGRPFTLGMLYDARTDELIPGATLWDNKTLQEKIKENKQHGSESHIIMSDSVESKSSLLDLDASLKASFMAGLIDVKGSAKFMRDKKKSHNQSRVTFQYKTTSSFKQLLMTDVASMNPEQLDVIEKSSATHVVTGILYGANAFFVFDSKKLDNSKTKDIEGSMNAVMKKIPTFNAGGKVDIKLTDDEKAVTDKYSCTFYGDFILDSNPTTFEDAVKIYTQLPQLLGEKRENCVPLMVTLMPLKNFNPNAAEVTTRISTGLIRKAQDTLEDVHHLTMRCNDCLEEEAVSRFPQICDMLSRFQKLCDDYTAALQESMTEKLPSIKSGKEDENELKTVFDDRDKSPFSHDELTKWMEDKEREVNVIRFCVEIIEGAKVVSNKAELDRDVLDSQVEDVLCFVFTSLEATEPHLQKMSDYLLSMKLQSPAGQTPPIQDQWYFSDEVITDMREKAVVVRDLARALKNDKRFCFLVAAIANEKYKGASIYHYRNAVLEADDFSKPDVPNVEDVTDRRDLIWYACDLTLDPNTANHHLTLSEGNKKVTHGDKQSCPDVPQRFDHLVQVLCRQALTGCCYWEVELSMEKGVHVAVAVCYGGLERKGKNDLCGLGWNALSWCFGHKWRSEPVFYAEHDKKSDLYHFPPTGCPRLGVYLDWPAGTLSYYTVSCNTLSHLHTFHTKFSEPVYAAFRISHRDNYALLCM